LKTTGIDAVVRTSSAHWNAARRYERSLLAVRPLLASISQHIEHLVRGEVNRRRLGDTRPRLGHVPLENLVGVNMAAAALGLQVRHVGVEELLQRSLGLLSFDSLLREEGLALLRLGFPHAARVCARGVNVGELATLWSQERQESAGWRVLTLFLSGRRGASFASAATFRCRVTMGRGTQRARVLPSISHW